MKAGPCKQPRVKLELSSTKKCLSLRSSFEGPATAPGDVMGFGRVSTCPQCLKNGYLTGMSVLIWGKEAAQTWGDFVCNDNKQSLQGASPPWSLGEDQG